MSTKTFTKDISVINYKQIAYTPPGTPTNNWSGLAFPPGTISNTGCSLVSAAMILNYLGEVDDLTNTLVTPYDIWRKGNFGVVDFDFYSLRDMFTIPLNYSPTDFSTGGFESVKSVMFDYIYNKCIPLIVRGHGYSTDGKEQGHFVVVRGFQGTLGIDAVTGYPM